MDTLVGSQELTRLLGVKRARVYQLTNEPDFPRPVAVLAMGSIWNLDQVRAWAQHRGRVLDFDALAVVVQDDDEGDPHGKRVS